LIILRLANLPDVAVVRKPVVVDGEGMVDGGRWTVDGDGMVDGK
jgi:hypothetical protein